MPALSRLLLLNTNRPRSEGLRLSGVAVSQNDVEGPAAKSRGGIDTFWAADAIDVGKPRHGCAFGSLSTLATSRLSSMNRIAMRQAQRHRLGHDL